MTVLAGKQINKSYILGKITLDVLKDIDFKADSRDFIVFAGPSGSGKTTLLNVCGLIDIPDSGQLLFKGQDISQLSERELSKIRKHNIGFIFQNFFLIPVMTAYENVEYPLLLLGYSKSERQKLVQKYLTLVGLWERKKHKPAELSGGERQRVAIARALVKKPDLVIADEPTANLDSVNSKNILQILKQLNQDEETTFLIASHDPLVIEQAKKVIHLRDGKITGEQGDGQ